MSIPFSPRTGRPRPIGVKSVCTELGRGDFNVRARVPAGPACILTISDLFDARTSKPLFLLYFLGSKTA
jgi:hypothetical protein